MIKINFKQPKYIFPLVIFVPLCALVYFVMQTFSGGEETAGTVATDRINMELPQANAEEAGDKMYEMSRRFGDEDAFTAVSGIGEEEQKKEELEHGYSEEELNRLDAAEAERQRQQQELEELERSLAEEGVSKSPPSFFSTKPRLSQAGALLLPKDFVSLSIKIYTYGKDTFSSIHYQSNGTFSAKNR